MSDPITPVVTITVVQERNGVQIHCSYNGFQKSNAANVATAMLVATEMYDWLNWLIEMDMTVASPNDKEKIKNVLKKARGVA